VDDRRNGPRRPSGTRSNASAYAIQVSSIDRSGHIGSTARSSTRLLDGMVLDDARLFTTKLQEWEDFYNFDRPHGGLGGQTPYERLRQKTGALA